MCIRTFWQYFAVGACSISLLVVSCTQKVSTEAILQRLIGTPIVFPENITGVNNCVSSEDNLAGADFIIASYTDGEGCTGCRMRLGHWIRLMEDFKVCTNADVRLIMIANPIDSALLAHEISRCNFTYPVYYDRYDHFKHLNSLPEEHELQTFLLDSDHRIIAVGNPAYNHDIARLYKSIMMNEYDDDSQVNQHDAPPIALSHRFIELGTMKPGECRDFLVALHNLTDSVIKIDELITSCSCTQATIGTDSLSPNERCFMTIQVCNDSVKGRFERYVDIVIDGQPSTVQLRIEGYGLY